MHSMTEPFNNSLKQFEVVAYLIEPRLPCRRAIDSLATETRKKAMKSIDTQLKIQFLERHYN